MKVQNQECCPEFEVEKWDKKTFNWENKLFLKETIPTFFHIPFPPKIGEKVMKMHASDQKSEVTIPDKAVIIIWSFLLLYKIQFL